MRTLVNNPSPRLYSAKILLNIHAQRVVAVTVMSVEFGNSKEVLVSF